MIDISAIAICYNVSYIQYSIQYISYDEKIEVRISSGGIILLEAVTRTSSSVGGGQTIQFF